jgi:high-affinity nickel-transport protein
MEISGVLLMFMLGLRHGFDPDHIAIIDGVSVRYTSTHPKLAKWTGTLFAAGHGSVVTLIAVMISCFSHSWTFSKQVWSVLDWAPGIVLIGVGLMNLRMLSRKPDYRPKGFKIFFIPKKLKNSSNPLAIVAIGILFAMVFDTNTQAAAWAYTATGKISVPNALLLGLSFSAGMILTDTLDSRILYLLMSRSTHNESVLNYRRKIGWIIVAVSLVVGVYKIASLIYPNTVLQESLLTLIGVCFFVFMALFYAITVFIHTSKLKKQIHGN